MATLQKLGEGRCYLLDDSHVRIGREPDNEIEITDDAVSGYHALVTIRQSQEKADTVEYIIEDLNSTNKTFVNNTAITQHTLKNGDIVRIGQTRLKFSTAPYSPTQKKFEGTLKLDPTKPFKH
jgi:pSer/pThr/pTyr-binding forkhead associated (FHA) protein